MEGVSSVVVATAAFVGTHFLLSHPLRRPLVGVVGETPFLGIYSLISFVTLGAMVWAYRTAPATPMLWEIDDIGWAIATVIMLAASVLLMGSVLGNPALPTGGAAVHVPDDARGVFAVTRHPMMWSFALWGISHILVFPVAKNIVVCAGVIILALVGAAFQDQKKRRLQPTAWKDWVSKTSYWPFAAILDGRARMASFGAPALVGGLVVWLGASWAHTPLSGWAAGVWRWIAI
jgi:uncharacterized membrane protein